ncbi:MAG: SH3 domain-containing protein [Anaerolineae bacterium]
MRWKSLAASLLVVLIGVSAVSAQTCDAAAVPLEALAASCSAMQRGDLCRDGQIASFDGMQGFSVDTVALGRTQANYPDVDAQRFVNIAFIGALQVQPIVQTSPASLPPRIPVEVSLGAGKANVRPRPVRSGDPIAQLENATILNATGLSRNGTWVRIQLPDQPEQSAWINRSLLHSDYDLNLLPVVSSDEPVPQYPEFMPMQGFSFASGSPCAGVVLQSGDNLARMEVNGVDLEFHTATIFLQNSGDRLTVNVLEGVVSVGAQGTTTSSVAGALVNVALDASGQASAAPEQPIPYDDAGQARLAGNYGQRPVAPAPAANATTIQAALVTPLSGVWKFTYPPPYTYASVEGPQCGSMSVKGGIQLFDVSVSIDGSSVSTYNPDINLGAGVRVHPGLYEFNDFSLEVLSPTRMTTTYDTNPLMACTSVITIEAEWLRSES